jgi:cyclic beta-1,2-glucan synthetase
MPSVHYLQGVRLRSTLTTAGTGRLEYDGLAVTRRLGDETCDADGVFIYLRDLDSGRFWSATLQPIAR